VPNIPSSEVVDQEAAVQNMQEKNAALMEMFNEKTKYIREYMANLNE
jgi:hypothetical protein